LPTVSTTPKFAAGVFDTGGKFATGIADTVVHRWCTFTCEYLRIFEKIE
jgi:hypothetical protein